MQSNDDQSAAPSDRVRPPARRIDHIAIATVDADSSAQWYVEQFGMVITGDELVESAGVRLVYLSAAGLSANSSTMLQLAEPFADGPVRRHIQSKGEGLHHICFTVDDIEQVVDHAGQSADSIFMGGRDRRACFLADQPLGVLIEVTENLPMPREAK